MKFVQISACATMPKVGYGLIRLFGLDDQGNIWIHDFRDFDEGAPVGTWKKVEDPHT